MNDRTGAGRLRQALVRLWEDLRSPAPPSSGWSEGGMPRVTGYPIARGRP